MAKHRTSELPRTQARLRALRSTLADKRLNALLVSAPANVAYISGFEGEGILVCLATRQHLISDGRYQTEAAEQAPDFNLVLSDFGYVNAAIRTIRRSRAKRIGFEAEHVTYRQHEELKSGLPRQRLVSTRGIIAEFRQVKDEAEIAAMRRAADITDRAFRRIRRFIRPGRTERQICAELERLLKVEGGDRPAFDPIVASGPNAARPHAIPMDRKVRKRDMVKLDFGAQRDGYCSDMTRMVFVGPPTPKQRKVYRAVMEAQRLAEEAIKAGVKACDVDAAARDHLVSVGLGEYFSHSLGHGVGRNIHELPSLSKTNEAPLKAGMIVTVEPGVYIRGWGGVRMEDMVLVTEDGCEALSKAPKIAV